MAELPLPEAGSAVGGGYHGRDRIAPVKKADAAAAVKTLA
jgi:hypothetical protein